MSWHYKSPVTFPALYLNVLKDAALSPDTPTILAADKDENNLKVIAEKFRHFKWCIRKRGVPMELCKILEMFDLRSKIVSDPSGFILYITAQPTKFSEFIRLNPELAAEIVPLCQ